MLYNGADIVAEYGPTWGLPLAQYTQGPKIDDPIIRATATAAQYYHQDGLGSVVGVSNNLGGTDATQRFDAWGNKIASTGTTPHYGYTGREPDETGLIFYRARYLDPTVGRFTQRDPIGLRGGLNKYTYVGENPLSYSDALGLFTVVGGVGGSFVNGIGGEGSVGLYFNPGLFGQKADAGVFVSGGMGGGYNIGVSSYGGVVFGDASNVNSPFVNINISIGVGSVTIMLDPATGNWSGITFGPAAEVGGSVTYTDTGKTGLRDLINKIQQIISVHGGGGTVGGLPGRAITPIAPYSGNQH
jgi:RHS repeat-associated protein